MLANDAKSVPALGFLTVLDDRRHGLFGGYLVLNPAGRPLEFHCTAPIKPNRAQQILYGPTLEPFLYGEQIGQTLLEKANIEPFLLCTDRQPVLAVRPRVSLPVALVLPPETQIDHDGDGHGRDQGALHRLDAAHHDGLAPPASRRAETGLIAFQLGRNRLAVQEGPQDDRRLIAERLGRLADSFDLAEPFGRIREAIEEAQQAVR